MKLALHRSITFWSGLLVIGFICRAWWDSSSSYTIAAYGRYWAEECPGGFVAGYDPRLHNKWLWQRGEEPPVAGMIDGSISVIYGLTNEGPRRLTCPKPLLETRDRLAVFLPFWLILLAVAAFWLGLLFWRTKRRAAEATSLS